MKPSYSKLFSNTLDIKSIDTNWFQAPMHNHLEYELFFLTGGSGIAYIDNYTANFEAGHVLLIGSNINHKFISIGNSSPTGIAVKFKKYFLGKYFLDLQECKNVKTLLEHSCDGLHFTKINNETLKSLALSITSETRLHRILKILDCLELIATEKEYTILNQETKTNQLEPTSKAIADVLDFTVESFHEKLTLRQVAYVANMSIPTFCYHFKNQIGKTYIDHLNAVRINHSCELLSQTTKPVTEIAYESGYNTLVHYHRQFLKLKRTTPMLYRKLFMPCALIHN